MAPKGPFWHFSGPPKIVNGVSENFLEMENLPSNVFDTIQAVFALHAVSRLLYHFFSRRETACQANNVENIA